MNYKELKQLFCEHESGNPKYHLTAHITFSSFGPAQKRDYPWESRTYIVSSDNKAFQSDMGGYSIYANCLDGSEYGVRLETYMAEEHGGKNGWIVEDCRILGYLLVEAGDMSIPAPKLFYSMDEAQDKMLSLMADYAELDAAQLKAAYAESGCRIVSDDYSAEKLNAWTGIGAEGKLWEIKPACIGGPLDITFCHEQG